jgi:hypothetical protein
MKLNSKPERILRVPYYGVKGNFQKLNPISGALLGLSYVVRWRIPPRPVCYERLPQRWRIRYARLYLLCAFHLQAHIHAGSAGPPPDFDGFAATNEDTFIDAVPSFGSW